MKKAINDPENYISMMKPIEGVDEANKRLEAFYEDVRAARQKHRMADVTSIVCVCVKEGDEFRAVLSHSHNGDLGRAEEMLAYALGRERKWKQEYIESLAQGKSNA